MPRRRPCLAPLPAPLGLRFRALLGLGFVPPPEPRPCVHCASIAYALLPAGRVPLCRHRADPESSSRSLPSGSPARIAPPPRAHRAPTSASPPHLSPRVAAAPGPWLARTAPYASLFRRMRERGPLPGNIRPKCMLFEIKMATSSPHASISGRNRAIQDTWRANLAAKAPFSRRAAQNHAWREETASAARLFRGSGPHSLAERALRPAARAWPAAACAPCHLARVHRRRLTRVVLRRPHRVYRAQPSAAPPIAVGASRRSGSSCCPRAAHAVPTGPRPRANRVPPTRGAVCAHPRPATRRASPCRAGPAAVPAIPVKWCGDTIAHTRKLRF